MKAFYSVIYQLFDEKVNFTEFYELPHSHCITNLSSFQDAVNSHLRRQNIKPHWMFALESLVQKTIQIGVNFLTPENAIEESQDLFLSHPNDGEPPLLSSPVTEDRIDSRPPTHHMELEKGVIVLQKILKSLATLELESNHGSAGSQASTVQQGSWYVRLMSKAVSTAQLGFALSQDILRILHAVSKSKYLIRIDYLFLFKIVETLFFPSIAKF